MPIRKTTVGTGITERTVRSYISPLSPAEWKQFEAACTRLNRPKSFQQHLETVATDFGQTLKSAGLPTTFGHYTRFPDGTWRPYDERVDCPAGSFHTICIWSIAERASHEPDSPVGYAARIVDTIGWFELYWQRGDTDEALFQIQFLGELLQEASMKRRWGDAALSGAEQNRNLEVGRKKGNARRKAERAPEHERWQQAATQQWKKNPHLSIRAVAQILKVQQKLSESTHTIRRHLKKPDQAG